MPEASESERIAVVLAGHGVPANDCPPELVGEMMGLEWRKGGPGDAETQQRIHARVKELDAKIRNWPRDNGNDPYRDGLEELAEVFKPLLPGTMFAIGYNEFCAPSVPEAIESVIQAGATRVLVVPTMMTPGGVHSEKDIPREIEKMRQSYPEVQLDYVWPFELKDVAVLLSTHVQKKLKRGSS